MIQSSNLPLLSFALPVRNGERLLPKLLDSLLAQDFQNFEIVISDNASTDTTAEICQRYAQQDSRIHYFRNPENIGILANFNRLIYLCQGKYIRWIGWDDWLEPNYASHCMTVLESRPDVVGVTTNQDFFDEDGTRDFLEYHGQRLDFPAAPKRYERILWFQTSDFRLLDPIYSMVRRDVLQKIGGHRLDVLNADQVLGVEMILAGPFVHIPIYLAHRGKLHFDTPFEQLLEKCYHNQAAHVKKQNYLDIMAAFWAPVQKSSLSHWEKFLCFFPFMRCFLLFTRHFAINEPILKLLKPVKKLVKNLLRISTAESAV